MSALTDSLYLMANLNSFDPDVRAQSLAEVAATAPAADGLSYDADAAVANMHCHSFFSYNALGLSPSALAVFAREEGVDLLGIVDFDVIDGVDEFLDACELLGVRGGASIETRLFVPEFATREINSPGEPGVYYHMGVGFTSSSVPAAVQPLLDDLQQRAQARNEALVARANAFLAPIAIDYEADVLPLTPSGNATERHVIVAYVEAVEAAVDDPVEFWSAKLDVGREQIEAVQNVPFGLVNLIRKRIMKQGGAAYVQPGPDTFPKLEEFHALVLGAGALPCVTWLDGMSEGERAMAELLDLLIDKGAAVLNIIPDRNWNITDPALKEAKLQNLYDVVALAQARDLPIIAGTEMNSPGQPLVDDFNVPELAPVRDAFLDGAHFLYGHTMLGRHGQLGYGSEWAARHLPDRAARNAFYTQIGRTLPAGAAGVARVKTMTPEMTPAELLSRGENYA